MLLSHRPRFLIAVPVFNEARYAARVLREIRKYARATAIDRRVEIRILVVDDGSTDATPEVLSGLHRQGQIDLLTHPENRGYGQSLIDAFVFSAEHAYDWVITMDCDEQHEPCRLPAFVRACLADDADIISGSRYLALTSDADAPPPDRRSINRFITDMLNATLSLQVAGGGGVGGLTDAFCGFKSHRVSAVQRMKLTIPGYAFPMQFWVQAAALGLRIAELPVRLIYKDATRHFGGILDDPSARLQHYLSVLSAELSAARQTPVAPAPEIGLLRVT